MKERANEGDVSRYDRMQHFVEFVDASASFATISTRREFMTSLLFTAFHQFNLQELALDRRAYQVDQNGLRFDCCFLRGL
jgi:hypothetical protein